MKTWSKVINFKNKSSRMKEDAVNMAVIQVKDSVHSVKSNVLNNEHKTKLRNYQFIKQKKFLFGKKKLKTL